MRYPVIEKKMYKFEELELLINEQKNISLQDLVETDLKGLYTIFFNQRLVIKDVEDITLFIAQSRDTKTFIHGIIDIYDRMEKERLFNNQAASNGVKIIENDNIADLIICSNLVINVLELNVSNFIQDKPNNTIALHNRYLVELYTDWNTQLHFKEGEFFKYLFN